MRAIILLIIFVVLSAEHPLAFTGVRSLRAREQWANKAYIKASNAGAGDFFGNSVAMSGDTLVINDYQEDSNQTIITNGPGSSSDNSATNSGAVFVYRKGASLAQEAYIKASNAEANDAFGYRVAIDGDTMVVSAYKEDSTQNTITNGAPASAVNGATDSGAVYVYRRSGAAWAEEAYIKPSNTGASDQFGSSVAISGDTIVVGAQQEDSNQTGITNGSSASSDNSAADSGAAYVFRRTGTTWVQEAYLKAANTGAGDLFGNRVAISGDTIVVSGHKESSSQNFVTNGATAPADDLASESGAAYVFKRTGSIWAQEAYLKASNAGAGDWFSYGAVTISEDTIVIGAQNEDSNTTQIVNGSTSSADDSATDAGAVYIYKRTAGSWAQEAYLKASNADAGDRYGFSVSIDKDVVAVGAYQEDSNLTVNMAGTTSSSDDSLADSGAVYVYRRLGSKWVQRSYLKAPNSKTTNYFGFSVAVSGNFILVGTQRDDSSQTTITEGSGAATDEAALDSGAAFLLSR